MIIGITGSFGSGKTSVVSTFGQYGFYVINVDRFYRALIKPGTELHKKAVKEFGKGILKKNKTINRKKLKKMVFNDVNKLKQLNKLTHPYIIKKLESKIKRLKNKNIAIDAPLLIEAKATSLVDKVVVVKAAQDRIMQRLIKKGKYTKEEIEKITKSQMPLKQKLKYADYVIDNNYSINNTKKQVKKIINMALK